MLKEGNSGLGFGVGKEPLVSLFASRGVNILATDLEVEQAARLGWVGTEQRSLDLSDLNSRGLCEHAKFSSLVRFRDVDMNDIPKDIGLYDFIWSSCAFEHLGSIKAGLEFVKKSSRLLRPGGIAIHTTEFNVLSNDDTLDNHPSFVIFRRKDFEQLKRELSDQGNYMEDVDYHIGDDTVERYVDLPPYKQEPHLRLKLAEKYVSTSVGIIIHAAS
jgi:cyclopropane fatty-acyl-phospholipid synthase-like methyltransferase